MIEKKNLIKENEDLKGVPYVLFYKKVKEENTNKNYKYDYNSEMLVSSLNENNKQIDIRNNINNMNSDEELINKAKGQNNDMNYSNEYIIIFLILLKQEK